MAALLVQIGGGAANDVFGIPPPDEQQAAYDAVVAETNAAGGIACRKIVPRYYRVNPADQSDLQAKCLDVVQAQQYVVLDIGAYADFPQKHCFAQNKVPYISAYYLSQSEADQFYPYLFAFNQLDALYRNTVFALRDRGFFDPAKGFAKLGFIYRSCPADLVKKHGAWFKQAGLQDAQIVSYDVGCPSGFASPSDLQQAVLKFRTNGVTHVLVANFAADFANFTKIAEQQGFRPHYGLGEVGIIGTSYGALRPDPNNIANAIAITANRWGEERTPGTTPSPGTARCNSIMAKHGIRPALGPKGTGGPMCNLVWLLKNAVEHAPSIDPSALATGLQRSQPFDMSYPQGPSDFRGDRVTTGGQFWRVTQFKSACQCWQVIDRTFRPAFK